MNLNVYYLAISGLQKAVRRNLVEQAVILGKIAWNLDKFRLYQRVHTIAFEECGTDITILGWLYEERFGAKEWDALESLIRRMALSEHKCNETVALKFILDSQEELVDAASDARLIELQELWPTHGFLAYTSLGFPAEEEWLLELCERKSSADREKLLCGVPYLFWEEAGSKQVSDCAKGSLWRGLIPLSAFDFHTSIGKFAIKSFYYDSSEFQSLCSIGDAGKFIFKNEGMLISTRKAFRLPLRDYYPKSARHISSYSNPEFFEKLNKKRCLVFKRNFSAEYEEFSKHAPC